MSGKKYINLDKPVKDECDNQKLIEDCWNMQIKEGRVNFHVEQILLAF